MAPAYSSPYRRRARAKEGGGRCAPHRRRHPPSDLGGHTRRRRDPPVPDGGARYLVAAEGWRSAAPSAGATRQPVIPMGGFMGGDPAPAASELRGLVRSGQVRYVLLGGLGNLIAAGAPPGGGGS